MRVWLALVAAVIILLVGVLLTVAACWWLASWRMVTLVVDPEELKRAAGLAAYFAGMSPCDVAARAPLGCDTADGYVATLVRDLPRAAFVALAADVAAARAALGRHSLDAAPGVPWRVAVLDDRAEGGWPHTHGDIICLPRSLLASSDERHRVRTLVHERVHVFQRANPEAMRHLLVDRDGLVPVPLQHAMLGPDAARRLLRRRSNPDLDGNLYSDDGGATAPVSLFPSERAAAAGGLAASRVVRVQLQRDERDEGDDERDEQEHPYEAMAYRIANSIVPSLSR
jgi:hypothetical protein